MSETTTDIVLVAAVTGVMGLGFAFLKGLFNRAVQETDTKFESLNHRVDEHEKLVRQHGELLQELRGTINSESWGLVTVVGKLSTNVEKLTSAVDRIDALMQSTKEPR